MICLLLFVFKSIILWVTIEWGGDAVSYVPNILTLSRILLSLILLGLHPLTYTFMGIYVSAGLTDIVDGYMARKFNATTDLGAKLDSLSDFVMVVVVLYKLLPVIQLNTWVYFGIGLITLIRFISFIYVKTKFNDFAILHTYLNKVTGLSLFLVPILLKYLHHNTLAIIVCILGVLSALEELIIHLTSDTIDLNQKTYFVKGGAK